MIRLFIMWRAKRRLDRLVRKQRDSFSCQDFRKRRQAGKLGWSRRAQA